MPLFRADHRQALIWFMVGLALLALFYLLAPILMPFVIAAVFAYVCDPLVRWLVGHGAPRTLAVALVNLAFGLTVGLFLLALVPLFYSEISLLAVRFPELVEMANNRLLPFINERLGIDLRFNVESIKQWLGEHAQTAREVLPELLSRARDGGMAVAALAINLIIVPIAMFYLLREWPRITQATQDMLPRPMLPRTLRIVGDINHVLAQYLRGQLSVMALLTVFYCTGLWLAGVDFALPVGIVTGLMSFIPFIGFGAGLTLAILAALIQAEGLTPLIGVAVVYGLGQVLESYILTPHLVGERIGLHPLAVIFALMAFGQLFGFIGVLIALPASAALLVGLRELRAAWVASPIYRGHEVAGGEPKQ